MGEPGCAAGPCPGGPRVLGPRAAAVGVRLPRWSLTRPFCPLCAVALGPIHLSEVRCRGYEQTLSDCPSLEGSQNGCQHDNDAAVRCNIPNMGFQDQVSPGLGSPEIAPDTACSQWGGFVRGR